MVLSVRSDKRPFRLIVEPWAEEFSVAAGDQCLVVALHPSEVPTFGAEVHGDGDLIVWVNESGSTFEFWRGEMREFQTPVAISYLPP